jgi:prenyltransferase beta subunit
MPSSIDYLISTQNETGGWGYSPGRKSVVEPTAAVLLAIRDEPKAINTFEKGMSWLLSSQHEDGGWGINAEDPESGWHTAWALIAMKYSNQNSDSIIRAVEWLTQVSTYQITQDEFANTKMPLSYNLEALIWPWLPGQGCWIEPTALAVLALEGIAQTQLAGTRIRAAIDYFHKNRTPSGGWDVGNAGPLDTIVLPHAYQTALVLMALTRVSIQEIQNNDLSALRLDMQQDTSILSLSSGLVALKTLGENDQEINSYISGYQLENGSWNNNPFFTAWAIMALRGRI